MAIIAAMSDPNTPTTPAAPAPTERRRGEVEGKVICERCGAEMFRTHAVWRCPACRYKTDCCGW
jgi:rubrerythrin